MSYINVNRKSTVYGLLVNPKYWIMSHRGPASLRISGRRPSWGRRFVLALGVSLICGGCWQEIRYEPDNTRLPPNANPAAPTIEAESETPTAKSLFGAE